MLLSSVGKNVHYGKVLAGFSFWKVINVIFVSLFY